VVKMSHRTKAPTVRSAMAAPILPKCRGIDESKVLGQRRGQ
jgi:hypothetical protein